MEGIHYANQKVLILAPHADDETLGCGGVIQKYVQHGSSVRVVVASFTLSGSSRYRKELNAYDSYSGQKRLQEWMSAMQLLGVTDYHILFADSTKKKSHDSKLDLVPRAELVAKIEQHITNFQPSIVYIPSITKHQDHEALHQAAIAATRPYFWSGSVLVYETDGEITFHPTLYVPIDGDQMNRKMKALAAYKTQVGSNRHPVNPESILHKAKFRGAQIYEEYAEAFEVIRIHG